MNVCLISPGWISTKSDVESMFSRCGLPLPLGLGYLASYAENFGFPGIQIIDLLVSGWDARTEIDPERVYIGLAFDELRKRLEAIRPDVVGVSCTFTSQAESLYLIADSVKRCDPKIKVIAGGAHPSSDPASCLREKSIDMVVRGEGEIPFIELLRNGFQEEGPSVKGVCFKQGGESIFSKDGVGVKNLDDIPYPAYHKFDMGRYFEANEKGLGQRGGYLRTFSIISSRGCPYQCVFCSIHNICGSKWRGRSPANVLGEIDLLVKEYGARHFLFEDDNLTMDLVRAEEIFQEMAKRHNGISWSAPNGIRADRMTEGLARAMRDSGCISVSLGIESGDQEFLNSAIKKKLNLKEVEKTAQILHKFGITVIGFFILGVPGETENTIKTSVSFAKRLSRKGLVPHFFIVTPLPGTSLYEISNREKLFVKDNPSPADYFRATYQDPMIRPTGMSMERLLLWRKKAVITSMLNLAVFRPLVFIKYMSGNNTSNLKLVFLGFKRKINMALNYLWN